ncbi:MAG: hypothetical protein AAF489_15345 [Bacteroidota bacterium]
MNKEEKYKHGLKVPEGYFENFEERLANKMHEEALPKTSGFKIPEGYFDVLEDQILQKIKKEETVKVVPLYQRKSVVYITSIAACLALILTIFISQGTGEPALEVADIEAYFDEGNIDYDSTDIAQLLSDADLENVTLENEDISIENLEDYLLENIDDTTLLIE